MALGWRRSPRAAALLFATLATAIWAGASIFFGTVTDAKTLLAANVADMLRYAGWLGFVVELLHAARSPDRSKNGWSIRQWMPVAVLFALITALALSEPFPFSAALGW